MLALGNCDCLSPHIRIDHAEIPTLVFLTKVDTYDPDVIGQDLKKIYHSERLLSLIEVSSYTCLPAPISGDCAIRWLNGLLHCAPVASLLIMTQLP